VGYVNLSVLIIVQYAINVYYKWIVLYIIKIRSLPMDGCMYWP